MSDDKLRDSFADIMRSLENSSDVETKAMVSAMELMAFEIRALAKSLMVVPDQLKDALGLIRDLKSKVDDLSTESDYGSDN
jgi:hypothetical protein